MRTHTHREREREREKRGAQRRTRCLTAAITIVPVALQLGRGAQRPRRAEVSASRMRRKYLASRAQGKAFRYLELIRMLRRGRHTPATLPSLFLYSY